MKKQILNLGKALNKAEQKSINGGGGAGNCSYEGESCGQNYFCCEDYEGGGFKCLHTTQSCTVKPGEDL